MLHKKNKSLIIIFLSIIAVLFLNACTEDTFSTVTTIKVEEEDQKIVANCIFKTDSIFKVQVSKASSIYENTYGSMPNEYLNDAIVQLFANGELLENLQRVNLQGTYLSTATPQPNTAYTLKISSPNLPSVEATATMPNPVKIDTVVIKNTNIQENAIKAKLGISFTDPANVTNYYSISCAYIDTAHSPYGDNFGLYENSYFGTTDPAILAENTDSQAQDPFEDIGNQDNDPIQYFEGGVVYFTDALFENKQKEIELYKHLNLYNGDTSLHNIVVTNVLYTVSPELYLHQRSLKLYYQTSDNPFAEPVQVYSNIKNGYGIFAGVGISYKDVKP